MSRMTNGGNMHCPTASKNMLYFLSVIISLELLRDLFLNFPRKAKLLLTFTEAWSPWAGNQSLVTIIHYPNGHKKA